jgi:hypothetical protein
LKDPRGLDGPHGALDRGALQVFSLDEMRRTGAGPDPRDQVRAYAAATEEALALGFAGLRVAAEVTPLVRAPEHVDAPFRLHATAHAGGLQRIGPRSAAGPVPPLDRSRPDRGGIHHPPHRRPARAGGLTARRSPRRDRRGPLLRGEPLAHSSGSRAGRVRATAPGSGSRLGVRVADAGGPGGPAGEAGGPVSRACGSVAACSSSVQTADEPAGGWCVAVTAPPDAMCAD